LQCDDPQSSAERVAALLLFLFNTGAHAAEVERLKVGHLQLESSQSLPTAVLGTQLRICPLWPATVALLRPLVADRSPSDPIFICRNGKPMSRFGIYAAVVAHAKSASTHQPSMVGKRISPQTLRNTFGVHLSRAGADVNDVQTMVRSI